MARQLRHFVAEPSACSYLPDRLASLEYRLLFDVTPEELDHLLARGWRRFGPAYFRPRCGPCSECVPLRVPVDGFRPSRTQRRVARAGEHIRLEIGEPTVDAARLELYRAWHRGRETERGWRPEQIDESEYFQQFAFPHPCLREFAYFDDAAPGGPALVAVSIVDETPRALSAVYTYHHPAYQRLSLGTLSVLRQIALAEAQSKRWVYLGYRVLGCQSSRYKASFQPHELLLGWPAFDERPEWALVSPRTDAGR